MKWISKGGRWTLSPIKTTAVDPPPHVLKLDSRFFSMTTAYRLICFNLGTMETPNGNTLTLLDKGMAMLAVVVAANQRRTCRSM